MTTNGRLDENAPPITLTTAQIGKCGELLVQHRLLRRGIESAPMTTDTGIDLVAFGPSLRPVTIQVKANARPKPAGGHGPPALDWSIADDCPATLTAFVDLSTDIVWLMTAAEVAARARQHVKGKYKLYFYTVPGVAPRKGLKPAQRADFDAFLFDQCVTKHFAEAV